ncbi:hypothetical protein [Candidatus Chloroploca sp. Khr17]|uniref:hypothetical protein n=1 Tax=Candidatus Chloroploca sp. Khr17 TaxID=2496869 RepID=UPI0013ED8548|nr:hypothetical protein [Candidatus Chloroploca sp. Khr17]
MTETNSKNLYRIGGMAALVQLAAIVASIVIAVALGPRPTSAAEFFAIQQMNPLAALLRGDFVLMVFLLGAYMGTFPALWWNLRHVSPIAATFATMFTLIAVTLSFSGEATFALLHLGDLYHAATSEAQRAQFLAAGEAVLAAGWWHGSGSYMTGMLLQGGGIIISLVMLKSNDFSKVTAISGLVGNALDLVQHLLHPFAPAVAAPIQMFMGVFYLVWFPMLAWDLFRLAQARSHR